MQPCIKQVLRDLKNEYNPNQQVLFGDAVDDKIDAVQTTTDRLVSVGLVGDDEERLDAVLAEIGVPRPPVARLHAVGSVQTVQGLLRDVNAPAGDRWAEEDREKRKQCLGVMSEKYLEVGSLDLHETAYRAYRHFTEHCL